MTCSVSEQQEIHTDIEYKAFLVYTIQILTTNLTKSKISDTQISHYTLFNELRDKGFGYQQIADYMSDKNIKTITGKSFSGSGIYSLMKNVANHLKKRKSDFIEIFDMKLEFEKRKK